MICICICMVLTKFRKRAVEDIEAAQELMDQKKQNLFLLKDLRKRLQSSCDKLNEKNNKYIDFVQNCAPETASREEEVYWQYAQKDDGLLEVIVKDTDAVDKILYSIEEVQGKQKVKNKLASNHAETNTSLYEQTEHKVPKITLPTLNRDLLNSDGFWESFSAFVDSKDLYSVQKFPELKGSLRDRRLSAIECKMA